MVAVPRGVAAATGFALGRVVAFAVLLTSNLPGWTTPAWVCGEFILFNLAMASNGGVAVSRKGWDFWTVSPRSPAGGFGRWLVALRPPQAAG